MLSCIRLILTFTANFAKMLFTIDIGDGLNLGLLMCICFIFLPMVHRIICFIKQDAMEELDDMYDESKPREITSSTYSRPVRFSDGSTVTNTHTITTRRRRRR